MGAVPAMACNTSGDGKRDRSVNARIMASNSYVLKEGDIVSVRGYGKFRFLSQGNMTKKQRIYVNLLIYA
jgi:RNA-binding protein YlmH